MCCEIAAVSHLEIPPQEGHSEGEPSLQSSCAQIQGAADGLGDGGDGYMYVQGGMVVVPGSCKQALCDGRTADDDDVGVVVDRLEIIILRKFPIILFLNSQFICYYISEGSVSHINCVWPVSLTQQLI